MVFVSSQGYTFTAGYFRVPTTVFVVQRGTFTAMFCPADSSEIAICLAVSPKLIGVLERNSKRGSGVNTP